MGTPIDTKRTMTDMAAACKISRPHWYHALRGNRKLSAKVVDQIVAAFTHMSGGEITPKMVKDALALTRGNFLRRGVVDALAEA